MLLRSSRLAIFAVSVLLLSSMAMADTVSGAGSFQTGWTASTNGSTFFNNASWDGNGLNIGFCMAGGGSCNFSGQPNSALPVFAGANFSAPGAFYLSPSGGGSANLTLEIAGNANSNQFGWYLLGTNPNVAANRNVLFSGPQGSGTVTNFNPSGSYGFYILAGGTTLYTSSLFGGATDQHFAVFQQADGTLWIGVEDLALGGSDRDFNDMVVKIQPVPEASSMAMLAIGLVGIVGAFRRKFRMPVTA